MTATKPDIDVLLPVAADSGAASRRAIDALGDRLPETLVCDLHLLVTEIVSNAIRHSGAGPGENFRLQAWVGPQTIRVEVHDPGPGFEPSVLLPRRPESGWGLFLLDTLASEWGVSRANGTRVWFELSRPSSAAEPMARTTATQH